MLHDMRNSHNVKRKTIKNEVDVHLIVIRVYFPVCILYSASLCWISAQTAAEGRFPIFAHQCVGVSSP